MNQQQQQQHASIYRPPRPSLFDADRPDAFNLEAYMRSGPHDIPLQNTHNPQAASSPNLSATPSSSDAVQHSAGKSRQDQPAWAEMKTKAGKDRKRLPLACIACRRKKIRCSGEKPACKHCLKSRIPCVYKVTTRKAAPRTDYMAMLDKRLKRMEDRVIRIIPKESERPNVARAIVKPSSAAYATLQPKKRSAVEAFGPSIDSWAAAPASASDPRRYPDARGDDATDDATLLSEGAQSLPSPELQEHLVEVYFDYVYGQCYYLLHKPSFTRLRSLGKVPPVLLLAVCAISARFSTHPQLQTEPAFLRGEQWAAEAQRLALKRIDNPNVTILTVFLLLGLHTFGTCQGGRSWMLGGIAHRMAYALQLHKELEFDPMSSKSDQKVPFSFLDREIRRRTMWACFMMDRFNSSSSERPMFAREQYIKIQLPVREDLFQMELPGQTEMLDGSLPEATSDDSKLGILTPSQNLGVAAFNIRAIALWGRLVQYWNLGGHEQETHPIWAPQSAYAQLATQIEAFEKSLPPAMRYGATNLKTHSTEDTANQYLFLHIAYNQIVLFLHRYAFPATWPHKALPNMPTEFLATARKTAVSAASAISHLVADAMNYKVVVPFAGYSAYLSGAVLVHVVFSRPSQHEGRSKELLTHNIKYLTKLKKYWGMFYFLTESLKELYRQYADAAGMGTPNAEPRPGPKRVFQYSDWYDRYPRGVSQVYYEEPATKDAPTKEAVLSQKSDLQSVEDFFAQNPQPLGRQAHPSKRSRTKSQGNNNAARTSGSAHSVVTSNSPRSRSQAQNLEQVSYNQRNNGIDQIGLQSPSFGLPENLSQSLPPPNVTTDGLSQPSPQFMSQDATMQMQMPLSPFDMVMPALSGPEMHGGTWDMDLSGFTGDAFGDSENAWFMPFNVNMPDLSVPQDFGAFGPEVGNIGQPWSAPGSVGPTGATPGSGGSLQ